MDGLARNTSSLALLWGSIWGGRSPGFHSKDATLVDHRDLEHSIVLHPSRWHPPALGVARTTRC